MEEPTATAELAAAPGHEAPGHGEIGHDAGHPGPAKYVAIAVILALVTGVEVGLYYLNLPNGLLVALLLGLAFIKFSMVAAYFMHLKFDSRLLRRVFVTGILLAAVVYTIALVTLDMLLG
jgi:cytochrome c oxidase subunit IV